MKDKDKLKKPAVLFDEEDWNSVQETLYLLSVPEMRESVVEGMKASSEEVLSKKEFLLSFDSFGLNSK